MKIVNKDETPVHEINQQMLEPRPLPMGRKEFEEWSDRIISGALIPNVASEDPLDLILGQKFALSNMLMHLGATESHKADAYFVHSLRKFAINQVADTMRKELLECQEKRRAVAAAKKAEESANDGVASNILNPDISPRDLAGNV